MGSIGVGCDASTTGAGRAIVVDGDVTNCTDCTRVPRGNVKTLVMRGKTGNPGVVAYEVASATLIWVPSAVKDINGVEALSCSDRTCTDDPVNAWETPTPETSSVSVMKTTYRFFMRKSPVHDVDATLL